MLICHLYIFFFYIFYFIYLSLAALGLCCCARAFSSCGERGLLFLEVHGLLIAVASLIVEHRLQARGPQQLWLAGSRAQAQQLWHTGLVAPRHVGSSRTRACTHVPCIGRQILSQCTTREAPVYLLQTGVCLDLLPIFKSDCSFSYCLLLSLWLPFSFS